MLRIEHWRRQGEGPALAFTAQQPAFFRLPARGVERMDIKQGEGSSEGPSVAFSRSNHAM